MDNFSRTADTIIHVHSEHSIKDSAMKIKDLIAAALAMHVKNLTLTDHGTCTGWIEFLTACKKANINGILGVEVYVETPYAPHAHLILLSKDYTGYQQISHLVSKSNECLVESGKNAMPVITLDLLRKTISGGHVIATSACIAGVLSSVFTYNNKREHEIEVIRRKQEKALANFDKVSYDKLLDKLSSLETQITLFESQVEILTPVASKKYGTRKKGPNNMLKNAEAMPDSPMKDRALKEAQEAVEALNKEIEETEEAKERLKEIKNDLKNARKKRTETKNALDKQKRPYENNKKYEEEIESIRESMLPDEQLQKNAEELAETFLAIFGADFYIELQYHGLSEEAEIMPKLAGIAQKYGIEVVAANDAHIPSNQPKDLIAREFMRSMRFGRWEEISDADKELYLKSDRELYVALNKILPEDICKKAIENTRVIGEACHLVIPGTDHYPKFIDEDGNIVSDSAALLRKKAEEGIAKCFPNGTFTQEYRDRLEYELQTIIDLGFADYLLIVADFIEYGKEKSRSNDRYHVGYGVGPGRGCQVEDGYVLTPNGPVRINSVQKGDVVYDGAGNEAPVLDVLRYFIKETVTRITAADGRCVTFTSDHKFYVIQKSENGFSDTPVWIKAGMIHAGDYLLFPKNLGTTDVRIKDGIEAVWSMYDPVEVSDVSSIFYEGYVYDLSVGSAVEPSYCTELCVVHNSGAGSLTNYLLGITKLDPLQYNLIFERFLNKDRVSNPDIDTDFSPEIREDVIEYVKQKYKVDNVASIRTAIKQGAKAAIRNAARMRGIEIYGPEPRISDAGDHAKWDAGMKKMRAIGDKLAAIVPSKPGTSLNDVMDELKKAADTDDKKAILNHAWCVENTTTTTSIHAAGVIISDGEPLDHYIPLLYNTGKKQWAVQCDMVEAEHDLKLLKMDFLGLINLHIITDCARMVKRTHGKDLDIDHLPFEKEVFKHIFAEGKTSFVFQFESTGMKGVLRELQPTGIEDIILAVAVYRPGPMDFIPDIIASKNGTKKAEYCVPELADILDVTYGYPVYQEQLMSIFHVCAGFSLGEADIIRRHMSKKHKEEFLAYRPQFINGVIEKGATEKGAADLWDSLTGFAEYGFNKSHAAAYAYISYITAYLKYHYPVEYMCAVLNHTITKKLPTAIGECRNMGIKILPPDINHASHVFEPAGSFEKSIRFGFDMIREFRKADADQIIEERKKNGNFKDFKSFILRTGLGESAVKLLVETGAFDTCNVNPECPDQRQYGIRYRLKGSISDVQEYATKIRKKQKAIEDAEKITDPKEKKKAEKRVERYKKEVADLVVSLKEMNLAAEKKYDRMEELEREKELLSAYISGHPIEEFQGLFKGNITRIADAGVGSGTYIGVVNDLVIKKRASDGAEMAFFDIDDSTGTIHTCLFAKEYPKYSKGLKDGAVVKISGIVKAKDQKYTDEGEQGEVEYDLIARKVSICKLDKGNILVSIEDPDLEEEALTKIQTYQAESGYKVLINRPWDPLMNLEIPGFFVNEGILEEDKRLFVAEKVSLERGLNV